MKTAIVVISDKSSAGKREDDSGPAIREFIEEAGGSVEAYKIIPDDKKKIVFLLKNLSDRASIDLILTSGGTGFAPRDVTPEATLEAVEKEVPGLPEKMRNDTSEFTEMAYLSRARAGIRRETLIVNLPGNPKAVRQCLDTIIDIIPHGLEVLKGEVTEH